MKDKCKEAYEDQLKFNRDFFQDKELDFDNLSHSQITDHLKEFILSFIRESTEALNTRKFKMHRVEDKEEIVSNTIEELVDCQKYLWGAFQLLGVSYEQFIEEYWRKTEVVNQRYFQEHKIKSEFSQKVVALDLDGVLCEYPEPWIQYVNKKLGTEYCSLSQMKLDVDLLKYDQLKSEYRQSGEKLKIKPKEGASEFTHNLRNSGHNIVVLTSRPYKKYNRLFPDTIKWLKDNNIAYDAIMFDERKNMKIVKDIPKLKFMVEDNVRYANSVSKQGYRVYLISPYTVVDGVDPRVIVVRNLHEILIREKLF